MSRFLDAAHLYPDVLDDDGNGFDGSGLGSSTICPLVASFNA